jgi:hypothetical protein
MAEIRLEFSAIDKTRGTFVMIDHNLKQMGRTAEREADRMVNTLKRKFSAADIGKDLMRGLGIGSGFALAQQAAEIIAASYKEAADAAKTIEEATRASLDYTKQLIKMRQAPDQRLADAKRELDAFVKETNTINDVKRLTVTVEGYQPDKNDVFIRALSKEESDRVKELAVGIGQLKVEIESLEAPMRAANIDNALTEFFGDIDRASAKLDELAEANAKHAAGDQDRRITAMRDGLKQQEQAFEDLIKRKKEDNEQTAKARKENEQLAEKYRLIIDPAREFKVQLEEIDRVMGNLTAEEYARAVDAVKRAMKADEIDRVDKALGDFFGDMDKMSKLTGEAKDSARELGFAFQSAFEDAILSGEKFSDVLRGLGRDMLQIMLRRSVTEPLGNYFSDLLSGGGSGAIGGIFGGIGKLMGFANGGDFTVGGSGGTDSKVVAFRATPGERVSIRTPAQADGGAGGITINQQFTFQSGVTRQEVSGMLPQIVEAAKNATLDAVSRGGSARRALA